MNVLCLTDIAALTPCARCCSSLCVQQAGIDPLGSSSSGSSSQPARLLAAVQRWGLHSLVLLNPYLHAGIEATRFVYQLCYLLDVTDCHSPVLQLLGQRLVRLSGQEMVREKV